MEVPFVSFRPVEQELNDELRSAFDRVYANSWYVRGEEDERFEKAFADYCGVRFCIGVGNGLDALMLALKALTSKQTHLPTIIFDEIDTGVSGKVASSMARIMQEMAGEAGQQVLAITHLPQIAAKADAHYFVYKAEGKDKTLSHIKQLDEEGRITELAHMLSGKNVTEAARENARQLINEE